MMQLDYVHPSPAQRLVLQQRLARLQDPSVALALLLRAARLPEL